MTWSTPASSVDLQVGSPARSTRSYRAAKGSRKPQERQWRRHGSDAASSSGRSRARTCGLSDVTRTPPHLSYSPLRSAKRAAEPPTVAQLLASPRKSEQRRASRKPQERQWRRHGSDAASSSGRSRARTCGLSDVTRTLSQLSYAPSNNPSILTTLANPIKRRTSHSPACPTGSRRAAFA